MSHMDCSSIIQNDRCESIYTSREVNSRDWNSGITRAWYQQIQTEQYGGEKESKKTKTKFKLHRSFVQTYTRLLLGSVA